MYHLRRFDRRRKIRRVLPPTDRVEIDVEQMEIESDLQCGVCLSVPRKTSIVMEVCMMSSRLTCF